MANILPEIRLLKDGNEKKFLKKTIFDVRRYIKAKDEEALKTIILRLDGLYLAMSKKAQEISLMIVNEIQEAAEKK